MLFRTCIADAKSNIFAITEVLLEDLYWILENHCDLWITAIADHVADVPPSCKVAARQKKVLGPVK
jgi:hypothetical protein